MIKIYRNNSPFNLSTSVKGENSKVYLIDFTGYDNGRGREASKAEFTTDSDKIQEAIESDPRYGKAFVCISHIEVEGQSLDKSHVNNVVSNGQDDTQRLLEVTGVTNTQMAIEWLAANKEYKFAARPSKAEVLSVATSLDVVFTEWK